MNNDFFNKRYRGSSLIEVLVTMIIIAIGLLGQASLIAISSKTNHSAFTRTQATLLSYDIFERLRLNHTLAINGEFNTGYDSDSASYDDDEIQHIELHDWKANVEQALPLGEAQITVGGDGTTTVRIRWIEVVKGSESDDGSIEPTVFSTQSMI